MPSGSWHVSKVPISDMAGTLAKEKPLFNSNLLIVVPVLCKVQHNSGRYFDAPKPWYAGS
jgi:hypothetical protein